MNNNTWINKDNITYYEKVPFEKQYGFSVKGGLDVFSDLKQLNDYIKTSTSILEIGACYGRVIDYLLHIKFNGKITAIERSSKFFEILCKKYQDSISLIHADISDFSIEEKFDLILWVWSGISDFSIEEQPKIIRKLTNFLTPSGTLIVDSVSHIIQPVNVSCLDPQNYELDITHAKLRGYIPSPEEMDEYAKSLDLKFSYRPYETSTQRPRAFYFFNKNKLF